MITADTSAQAAASIRPTSGSLRRQVCRFIAEQGAHGATDEECQLALEMNPSTQRPRRGECWGYGMLTDTLGEVRKTSSGRNAVVWHVTAKGIEALGMPAASWSIG